MINFLINQGSLELGIGRYLGTRGKSLQNVIRATTYEDTLGAIQVPAGTWVFTALDTLSPAERVLAASLHAQLSRHAARTLNDPARSLLRYDLLDALYHGGLNSFRAVRAREYRGGLRYPVFLRSDAGHGGNQSPLLFNDRDVRRALLSAKLRLLDIDNLLVVEFLDLADGGQRHKYSAFRVGDRILGRHFQRSAEWMIKSESGERSPEAAAEESAYIAANPHELLLMPLFQLAGIEYGRMDYAVHRGRVEVFEINTAPTLGRGGGSSERQADRDAYRQAMESTVVAFHGRMCDAFRAVDTPEHSGEVAVYWDEVQLTSCFKERRRSARQIRLRDRVSGLANVGGIRELRRGVETLLHSVARGP